MFRLLPIAIVLLALLLAPVAAFACVGDSDEPDQVLFGSNPRDTEHMNPARDQAKCEAQGDGFVWEEGGCTQYIDCDDNPSFVNCQDDVVPPPPPPTPEPEPEPDSDFCAENPEVVPCNPDDAFEPPAPDDNIVDDEEEEREDRDGDGSTDDEDYGSDDFEDSNEGEGGNDTSEGETFK